MASFANFWYVWNTSAAALYWSFCNMYVSHRFTTCTLGSSQGSCPQTTTQMRQSGGVPCHHPSPFYGLAHSLRFGILSFQIFKVNISNKSFQSESFPHTVWGLLPVQFKEGPPGSGQAWFRAGGLESRSHHMKVKYPKDSTRRSLFAAQLTNCLQVVQACWNASSKVV